MKFDMRTVVLVTRRLIMLTENPPLFHERVTPATIARRLDRVVAWIGGSRGVIVAEYLRRGEVPPAGRRNWCRIWREQGDA